MAAKRIDPLKAKAAKQKKVAIGLGLVFVLVLAYQGPKTLKMLKGPQPIAEAATPTPVPVTSTTADGAVPPGTPGEPAGGVPAEAQPAVLVDSDLALEPAPGKLLSFELFDVKDPFGQQVDAQAAAAPPQASAPASDAKAAKAAAKPADSPGVVPGSAPGIGTPPAAPGVPPVSAPAPPAPAAATSISVNGLAGDVALEGEFPAESPAFVLVSSATDGKSVQVGIAGGSYANGKDTIKLELGKPLTLQNTADGSRYELELLAVQGFVTLEPAK